MVRENYCRFPGDSILIWISEASNFRYWEKKQKKTKMILWVCFDPRVEGDVAQARRVLRDLRRKSWWTGGVPVRRPTVPRPLGSKPHSLKARPVILFYVMTIDHHHPKPQVHVSGERLPRQFVSHSLPNPPCRKPAFRGASCSTSRGCRWTGSAQGDSISC